MTSNRRLETFAVGADGNLLHIWQTKASNGWSGRYLHADRWG